MRITRDDIWRFSGVLLVVSLDARESRTNWQLRGDLPSALDNTAFMPNICADDMTMRPSNIDVMSIFADRRWHENILWRCWSSTVTSSTTILLSRPRLMLPRDTFVPSLCCSASDVFDATACCTAGIWSSTTPSM